MAPYTRAQPPLAAGSFFFPTLPLPVLNFSSPPSLPLVSFESLSFRYLLPLIFFFSSPLSTMFRVAKVPHPFLFSPRFVFILSFVIYFFRHRP